MGSNAVGGISEAVAAGGILLVELGEADSLSGRHWEQQMPFAMHEYPTGHVKMGQPNPPHPSYGAAVAAGSVTVDDGVSEVGEELEMTEDIRVDTTSFGLH